MNPPYPSDAQAKAEILDAGRKIYQRGLVAANDGNLSVRVGDNALWVTPTGVSKGAMTEDMLVKLSLDGTVLEGTRKPSSETKMHLRIYQENPAVRAVVHDHPPAATAFAAAGLPLARPAVWNVWNSWPPSPSTCGLWAFIARCRSPWLRRWRGCAPPGASSDPAAVLLPSERVSPFRPLIGGNSTQLIPNFS